MTVSTEGDLGDVIALLGILRELNGGPHTLLLEKSGQTKYRTDESIDSMEALIKPLAELQPYIKECRKAIPGEPIDWRSAGFRAAGFQPGNTLLQATVDHLIRVKQTGHGITGREPWLFNIDPSPISKDRIIINRTGRWVNGTFPWGAVVKHYHWRLMFIGLPHEYRAFCGNYGYVDYQPVNSLLESAQLIAGSLLFIGNQSCANWLCEGLKHSLIQETCQGTPDCIFVRPNAQHVWDGRLFLPGFEGDSDVLITPVMDLSKVSLESGPPGGWIYPCPEPTSPKAYKIRALSWHELFSQCKRDHHRFPEFKGMPDNAIKEILLKETFKRVPHWQSGAGNQSIVETAIQRAQEPVRKAPVPQPKEWPRMVPHV